MFVFRISLILILLLFSAISVFAQGDYLESGEKGIKIGLFAPLDNEQFKIGGIAGLSIGGMADFDLSFQKSNFPKTYYTKSLAVYLLRPNGGRNDFGLKFTGGTISYSLGDIFSNNIYSYGFTLYRDISSSAGYAIIPSLGFSILKDNLNSNRNKGSSFDLGLSGYFRVYKKNRIKIALGYSAYSSDWIEESGENKKLELQASYIIQGVNNSRVSFSERRKSTSSGKKSEAGFGVAVYSAGDVSAIGIRCMIRESDLGEGGISLLKSEGSSIGISGGFAVPIIKGGSKYKRAGLCITAGAASLGGSSSYSIGAGIYGDFYSSNKMMIQPMAGVAFVGIPGTRNNGIGFEFSLMVLSEISSGVKSRIDIGVSIANINDRNNSNYSGTLGLSMGLMFGGTSGK